LVSFAFAIYARSYGQYNKTYGALGGVIVLLLWLFLSSLAVLLGAELNAELEHQTAVDTTVGPPRAIGDRRAVVADTLGEERPRPKPVIKPAVDRISRIARAPDSQRKRVPP
jgi:membrane protein